ncbi:hypothetical protein ACWGM4_31470 [Streptomyces albidoflavus]|uniref:hypothetical protein n=1 Tax=unclassified Streptomyces TaxID=2593676 RepID=UPI001BEBDC60|nr:MULTISPECIES: hypothetical protein [unclassified Streptomyces]MBT2881707.1 hypothetical protein [Streptomyces sp. McG6]MBT2888407.1 hypothetical protein [Streptomyces sp. McG5]MBT2889215.1 hypothetical protein [Streptomyces sp. McG2]
MSREEVDGRCPVGCVRGGEDVEASPRLQEAVRVGVCEDGVREDEEAAAPKRGRLLGLSAR